MSNEYDNPYQWYEALFCRELGMCEPGRLHWGWHNYDPTRIVELAQYYKTHPMYSRVGREMLLESLMASAQRKLDVDTFSPDEEHALRTAVQTAIEDLYDRDVIASIWVEVEDDGSISPLANWLRIHFPGWEPPPSIWSSDD